MGLHAPSTTGLVKDKKLMPSSSARISQETFDEAVRENVTELDMDEAEALTDAISQFEAQGIDLSNIIKEPASAARDAHPVLHGIAALLDATRHGTDVTRELSFGAGSAASTMRLTFKSLAAAPLARVGEDDEPAAAGAPPAELAGLTEALDALAGACALDGEEGARNCEILGSREGIDALASACLALLDRPELAAALGALAAGLRSAENRNRVGLRGLLALYAVVLERAADPLAQAAAFRALSAAMVGSEENRVTLHDKLLLVPKLKDALCAHADTREVVLAACAALRALTLQDDGRVAINKGFERARAAYEVGCLPLLAEQLSRAAKGAPDLVLACCILNTLSRLTASAKICARARVGGAGNRDRGQGARATGLRARGRGGRRSDRRASRRLRARPRPPQASRSCRSRRSRPACSCSPPT